MYFTLDVTLKNPCSFCITKMLFAVWQTSYNSFHLSMNKEPKKTVEPINALDNIKKC